MSIQLKEPVLKGPPPTVRINSGGGGDDDDGGGSNYSGRLALGVFLLVISAIVLVAYFNSHPR